MKYWWYFIIGGILLLHPHLAHKLGMLYDYFTNPGYEFWTTFNKMDFLDLFLHAGLPIVLIIMGLNKQRKK